MILYILHGSDKSNALDPVWLSQVTFTSYMVPIKGGNVISILISSTYFTSYMVPIKDVLVPKSRLLKFLYILHGSDKSLTSGVITNVEVTLHPTWFR